MKRSDRQVLDQTEIDNIISRCAICRLGMFDGEEPYIVPMNFGYKDKTVYFHGAREGRRVDILTTQPKVCMEFDVTHDMIKDDETACKWSQKYESVIAWGTAELPRDHNEKKAGLDIIMGQYSDRKKWEYTEALLERTQVIKVVITKMTAKRFVK